jgi:DNA-binding NarL/FixJ family response regulator
MSLKTVRVLIVDDHAVVREGYRALLEKHEGLNELLYFGLRQGLVEPVSPAVDSGK